MNTHTRRFAAALGTCVLGVTLLAGPTGANATGNSDGAAQCQRGGYLNYTDAGGNLFRNAGQCTAYAAQGGMLVPVPTADISLDQAAGTISGTGFTPNSPITNARTYFPSGTNFTDSFVSSDATGAWVDSGLFFCFDSTNTAVEVTSTDAAGIAVTKTFTLDCGSSALRTSAVADSDRS